jgi:hypothetical protein
MSAATLTNLLAEWERIHFGKYSADDAPEIGRLNVIERQMTQTPALTLSEALVKATLLAHWEHEEIIPEEEADYLAASLKSDLERLARPAARDEALFTLFVEYSNIPDVYPKGTSDEEVGVGARRQMEIIEALPAMPAATPEGIKFKLVALDYVSENFSAHELVTSLVASMIADLDRMAGGAL